tara:strand:- start:395 stop:712 length:318 start_codon:yes stop_codon:yes gene_type:complete
MKNIFKIIKLLSVISLTPILALIGVVEIHDFYYSDTEYFYNGHEYPAYIDKMSGHIHKSEDEAVCDKNVFDDSVFYFTYYHEARRDCLRRRIEMHKQDYASYISY